LSANTLKRELQHWRRGRDSNPRWAFTQSGFQDRRDRPLCHLSASDESRVTRDETSRHPSLVTPITSWHGRRDLNPQPTVLETATLPIELLPYPPNLVSLSDTSGAAGVHPHALKSKLFQAMTSDTRPAPMVRPPSRIAKRWPRSIATGAMTLTSTETLSPGITISMFCGSVTVPVTSVVRK
jgi:hypothetical protein